jgi:hypothetical protein
MRYCFHSSGRRSNREHSPGDSKAGTGWANSSKNRAKSGKTQNKPLKTVENGHFRVDIAA